MTWHNPSNGDTWCSVILEYYIFYEIVFINASLIRLDIELVGRKIKNEVKYVITNCECIIGIFITTDTFFQFGTGYA